MCWTQLGKKTRQLIRETKDEEEDSATPCPTPSSALGKYLQVANEPSCDEVHTYRVLPQQPLETDILVWWGNHLSRFPFLAKLALSILSTHPQPPVWMPGLFVTQCTSSPVPTFVLSGQLRPPGAPQHEFSNPVPVFAHSRQAQLSVRFGGMGVQAGVAEVFAELVPKKCLSGQRLAKPCSPSAFAHHVSPLLGRGLAESLMHRNRITPWGVSPRLPQLVPSPQPPFPQTGHPVR